MVHNTDLCDEAGQSDGWLPAMREDVPLSDSRAATVRSSIRCKSHLSLLSNRNPDQRTRRVVLFRNNA